MERHPLFVPALVIALGMVLAAHFLGDAVRDMRRSDRYVTVKGLVERDVTANLALWPIKFRVSGDELLATQTQLDVAKEQVVAFLKEGGLGDEEINVGGIRVIDRQAREYGEGRPDQTRYIIEATVMARSDKVEAVSRLSRKASDLVKTGVALAEENTCQQGPAFQFTKLNEIKPEMLAEATKNARKAADQFAADSGSRVGAIRQASQGFFSISSRDRVTEGEEGGGCGQLSDIHKRVRVVTTLDYYLEE